MNLPCRIALRVLNIKLLRESQVPKLGTSAFNRAEPVAVQFTMNTLESKPQIVNTNVKILLSLA